MQILFIAILLIIFTPISVYSQTRGFVRSGVMGGTGKSLPFWMITNHYGPYTPQTINAWLDAGIFSDTIHLTRKLKLDLGTEVFGRYDGSYHGRVQQGYAELKYGILNFYAGRKEEHFGSQDPELSSGFVMWSGNALPVPQLSLATNDFVRVPYTRGFVEVKTGISHGWFGNDRYVKDAMLHHTWFYLQFGGMHSFHFTAGLHHFAEWGGVSPDYGRLPSGIQDFVKVLFAQNGGDTVPGVPYNEWENRFGNHLGTKDISLDYRFKSGLKLKLYWQNLIEDITGMGFRNISDGLWGIQVEQPGKLKFGYEFFSSVTRIYKSNGDPWRGGDNYFNNSIYRSGWTYHGYTIGNPLITSPVLLHPEYPELITNNRVAGHIVSFVFFLNKNSLNMRYSFTENYGGPYVLFIPAKIQHSFLLTWKRDFSEDKIFGKLSFGWDQGELLGDHVGVGLDAGIRF